MADEKTQNITPNPNPAQNVKTPQLPTQETRSDESSYTRNYPSNGGQK